MDIVQTIRDAAARIRAEFDHPNAPATDADDLEKIAEQIASITRAELDRVRKVAEEAREMEVDAASWAGEPPHADSLPFLVLPLLDKITALLPPE